MVIYIYIFDKLMNISRIKTWNIHLHIVEISDLHYIHSLHDIYFIFI